MMNRQQQQLPSNPNDADERAAGHLSSLVARTAGAAAPTGAVPAFGSTAFEQQQHDAAAAFRSSRFAAASQLSPGGPAGIGLGGGYHRTTAALQSASAASFQSQLGGGGGGSLSLQQQQQMMMQQQHPPISPAGLDAGAAFRDSMTSSLAAARSAGGRMQGGGAMMGGGGNTMMTSPGMARFSAGGASGGSSRLYNTMASSAASGMSLPSAPPFGGTTDVAMLTPGGRWAAASAAGLAGAHPLSAGSTASPLGAAGAMSASSAAAVAAGLGAQVSPGGGSGGQAQADREEELLLNLLIARRQRARANDADSPSSKRQRPQPSLAEELMRLRQQQASGTGAGAASAASARALLPPGPPPLMGSGSGSAGMGTSTMAGMGAASAMGPIGVGSSSFGAQSSMMGGLGGLGGGTRNAPITTGGLHAQMYPDMSIPAHPVSHQDLMYATEPNIPLSSSDLLRAAPYQQQQDLHERIDRSPARLYDARSQPDMMGDYGVVGRGGGMMGMGGGGGMMAAGARGGMIGSPSSSGMVHASQFSQWQQPHSPGSSLPYGHTGSMMMDPSSGVSTAAAGGASSLRFQAAMGAGLSFQQGLMMGVTTEEMLGSLGSPVKKKRKHKKKPADMPRRPLSAYNLFFSEERERILKELDAESGDGKDSAAAAKDDPSADDQQPKPEEEMGSPGKPLALMRPLIPSQKKRRPHRKTHGKISFQELARMVGERWKNLADDRRAYYQDMAKEDMKRQKAAMEAYYARQNEAKLGSGRTSPASTAASSARNTPTKPAATTGEEEPAVSRAAAAGGASSSTH